MHFAAPSFLDVELVGYSESGAGGMVTLSLNRKLDERREVHVDSIGKLSSDGKLRFGPTESGLHQLTFMKRTDRFGATGFRVESIEIEEGENTARFDFPRFHALRIKMDPTVGSPRVSLSEKNTSGTRRYSANARVDAATGIVDFGRVPAGEYTATARTGKTSGEMQFTLAEDTELIFEPRPVDAMRIRITDDTGYLVRAGFRDDDLVIGIDGEPFETTTQMHALYRVAQTKGVVQLTVERDGESLTLPFDAKIRTWPELGGRLEDSAR